MNTYYGQTTRSLENARLKLEFLTEGGPRIVRLFLNGSTENFLAEVPGPGTETPFGTFNVRGGHRLWHAPESMPRTYLPDNSGLVIEDLADGVRLIQPVEAGSHIRKSMDIHLDPQQAALSIVHHLENCGLWAIELAPWAITQLPIGGTVILPEHAGPLDKDGLLPNRNLVLWPYTRWQDPRLTVADEAYFLYAQALLPPIKIGYFNRTGWIGYINGGNFFCKRFNVDPASNYPDNGCNAESYCNDLFIELETIGALVNLQPGKTAVHTERWEFYSDLDITPTVEGLRSLIQTLHNNLEDS